ncbi:hypothetical protein GOV11_00755 [Candidatus Woesearchaeota archaeon]|nr:hypothetical protein [Candidatus Woesearchaeota archaeon]
MALTLWPHHIDTVVANFVLEDGKFWNKFVSLIETEYGPMMASHVELLMLNTDRNTPITIDFKKYKIDSVCQPEYSERCFNCQEIKNGNRKYSKHALEDVRNFSKAMEIKREFDDPDFRELVQLDKNFFEVGIALSYNLHSSTYTLDEISERVLDTYETIKVYPHNLALGLIKSIPLYREAYSDILPVPHRFTRKYIDLLWPIIKSYKKDSSEYLEFKSNHSSLFDAMKKGEFYEACMDWFRNTDNAD